MTVRAHFAQLCTTWTSYLDRNDIRGCWCISAVNPERSGRAPAFPIAALWRIQNDKVGHVPWRSQKGMTSLAPVVSVNRMCPFHSGITVCA